MAATKEDVQRILDEATKGGSKPRRMIRVTGTLKMPGKVQYAMRHLSFTVEEELPADRKRSDVVREICDDLAPLVLELESKSPIPSTAQQPATASHPYNIARIQWFENKFGPGEYAHASDSEAAELLQVLKNTGKAVEINGQSYSLNQAGTYIYRKPAGAK